MEVAQDTAAQIERAWRLAAHQSSLSARAYLDHVVIDSRPEPRLYRHLAKPWQWYFAEKLTPALESVCGVRSEYTGPRSFWLTLPRGHDKTSLIARLSNWTMGFTRRRVAGVCAAADREQAGLLHEFAEAEADLNPWLRARVGYRSNKLVGRSGSYLKIISADAYSSYGLKVDLIVCDELTHWPKRDLWDSLWSGRQKRPDAVFVVITNAGMLKTWQHDVVQMAKESPHWFVYDKPGRFATWMDETQIRNDRRLLPPGIAARVLDNRWVDPAEGSGFISRSEAQACEDQGRALGLRYEAAGKPGTRYWAGIDYGPVKDRTVLCVLHRAADGTVLLDQMRVLQGRPERRVRVEDVEDWMERTHRAFNHPTFVVDPYGLESTIQKYQGKGYEVERFTPRGGKANYELAANLRTLIINGLIAWYPRCGEVTLPGHVRHGLVDELAEVTLRTTAAGFRIDNTEPGTFDDRVVSLGMAALSCCKEAEKKRVLTGDFWF
jgi:hypothetical protein